MLFGRFSVEWVALVVLLTFVASWFGGRTAEVHPAWALLLLVAIYGSIRLVGRTPIGITYESHPASRGYPVLSFVAAIVITAIAFRSAVASMMGNQ